MRVPAPSGVLEALLDVLFQEQVHLALLPELALDGAELDLLRHTLRGRRRRYPALVVAGLAHRAAPSGSSHVNEAVVLTAQGEEVMRHEKLEPFTDEHLGMEDIVPRQSSEYFFIDSPVGRLVVNICRDVRSDVPLLLNRALGASLLLVPAYSKRLDFVLEEARVLGQRQLAITVATNPMAEGLRDLAAIYAPVRGDLGSVARQMHPNPQPAGKTLDGLIFRLRVGEKRQGEVDAGLRFAV